MHPDVVGNGRICRDYSDPLAAEAVLAGEEYPALLSAFDTDHSVMESLDEIGLAELDRHYLIAGVLLYHMFHLRWWDYSEYKVNLRGYICLRFTIYWGIINLKISCV